MSMLKSRFPLVSSIVLLGVVAGARCLSVTAMAAEDPETWKWNDPKEMKIPGLHHEAIESAAMNRTVGY